jgi:copper chaperone CopZ
MNKMNFDITGMSCSACSARIEKNVSKLAGIDEVSVNLLTNSMSVLFDEGQVNAGQIVKTVEGIIDRYYK